MASLDVGLRLLALVAMIPLASSQCCCGGYGGMGGYGMGMGMPMGGMGMGYGMGGYGMGGYGMGGYGMGGYGMGGMGMGMGMPMGGMGMGMGMGGMGCGGYVIQQMCNPCCNPCGGYGRRRRSILALANKSSLAIGQSLRPASNMQVALLSMMNEVRRKRAAGWIRPRILKQRRLVKGFARRLRK